MGNNLSSIFSLATEFPGPLDLSKLADPGDIFPEIPARILQKIATERCDIPPLEVTEELLLTGPKEVHKEEGGSSSQQQMVAYG